MKRYEDFTGGLQKEVRIPEQVWSQYMDTLENIETLAAERKGEDRMGRKRKHAGRTWIKAAAAAGVLLAGTMVFGCVDPVAASELPLIGRIFERIAEDTTYSGDYTEKTVLQEEQDAAGRERRKQSRRPSVRRRIRGLRSPLPRCTAMDIPSIWLWKWNRRKEGFQTFPRTIRDVLKKSPARCSRRPEAGGPEKEKRTS